MPVIRSLRFQFVLLLVIVDYLLKVMSTMPLRYINFWFVHLFVYIPMNQGLLFYQVAHNPLMSLFILMLSCPRFGQWMPFKLSFGFFWSVPHHWSLLLFSGTTWYSGHMQSFSALPPESAFLPGVLVLLRENRF